MCRLAKTKTGTHECLFDKNKRHKRRENSGVIPFTLYKMTTNNDDDASSNPFKTDGKLGSLAIDCMGCSYCMSGISPATVN